MKWEQTSRDFFKLLKKNIPHGCFQNPATFCKWFSGETKERLTATFQNLKEIRYFNIINIAGCWWGFQSTTKVQVHNFPLLHFPKWLCLVHAKLAISLRCVKSLVICKCKCLFLSLRYSTMVSFILSTTFSVTEIHPRRDSAKCQLLRLYS